VNAQYDLRGSLGMLNMRERAEAIGGRLSIQSQAGGGTVVMLTVDLAPLRNLES
jgi:signal transduction histidine kinase